MATGALLVGLGAGCQIVAGLSGPDVLLSVDGGGAAGGATARCADGHRDGEETGKDCGGGECAACPNGEACKIAGDCLSGSCGPAGVCLAPACTDQVANGDETDVDCGGATCATRCVLGKKCREDDDCRSGHCACAGASCATGTCDVVTLASGQQSAYGIAVLDTSVFWTDVIAGTVMKGTIGGGPSFPLATGQASPKDIVATAVRVYWITDDGVGVTAVEADPDAGSMAGLLAHGMPMGLALSGANLYWTDQSTDKVMYAPVGGGPPFPLTSALEPWGIAVDGTGAYWTEPSGGTVMKFSSNDGTTLIASGQASPKAIAVDGSNVYWGTFGGVFKAPVAGGTPSPLASGAPVSIAVDGTHVYWTDASAGTVMKVAVDGGPPVLLASDQPTPTGIAVDGTSVYWAGGAYVRKVRK
jgi:hypothetical protein